MNKYLPYFLLHFFTILCIFFNNSLSVSAQEPPMEIHCKHFFKGYPLGTPKTNDLIIRDLYAMSHNDQTKFADWVAFRLTPHEVMGDLDLEREWRNDPWLEDTETLEAKPKAKDDYKDAGDVKYDRGHLAPLASFRGSRYASQVNYYSNIAPQKSDLNQGSWRILEDKVRELVMGEQVVYVMLGTLYEREMRDKLPNVDEPCTIPSGFWEIVIAPIDVSEKTFQVMAFIFEQDTPRNNRVLEHLTSVKEIERRSKLNFFWMIPREEQEYIEEGINREWAERVFGN